MFMAHSKYEPVTPPAFAGRRDADALSPRILSARESRVVGRLDDHAGADRLRVAGVDDLAKSGRHQDVAVDSSSSSLVIRHSLDVARCVSSLTTRAGR